MLESPLLPELEEGLSAVDEGDLEAAQQALDVVESKLGADHARTLHLRGSIAWAKGDLESAQMDLKRAVLAGPTDPVVCLDSAELALSEYRDHEGAERTIADLLRTPTLEVDAKDEANFMMARSLSAHEEDAPLEKALTHLDAISSENRNDPGCCLLRAEILLDLGRGDDAVRCLEEAVEIEGEEPDLFYLLSIALREEGDSVKAAQHALRCYALDCESMGPTAPIEDLERQELRGLCEELFEELPDPLLRRVANARIEVVDRLTAAQVKAGADPRACVLFEGQASSQSEQENAEKSEPKLDQITLVRDMLIYGLEDDDPEELSDSLLGGLAAELQRFFGLDDLVVASA